MSTPPRHRSMLARLAAMRSSVMPSKTASTSDVSSACGWSRVMPHTAFHAPAVDAAAHDGENCFTHPDSAAWE